MIADSPRRGHRPQADPQLAKIYYTQMVDRGADHIKALCVVAAALAARAWTVMRHGMPYVICDTDGHEVPPASRPRRANSSAGTSAAQPATAVNERMPATTAAACTSRRGGDRAAR